MSANELTDFNKKLRKILDEKKVITFEALKICENVLQELARSSPEDKRELLKKILSRIKKHQQMFQT